MKPSWGRWPKRAWQKLALISIILFVVGVRIRLLDFPLERDEGEYAYMGQLILAGADPSQMAYTLKLPGIYLVYAAIMAFFGQTIRGIHLGLLLANGIAVWLVFLFTRKLINDTVAVVAAGTYGFLSLSDSALGFAAHATQFLVPLSLLGSLFVSETNSARYSKSYLILAGLFFGLAILIKAVAIFFLFFGVFFIFISHTKTVDSGSILRKISWLLFGAIVPLALCAVALQTLGIFSRFWYWAIRYNMHYATQVPVVEIPQALIFGLWGAIQGFPGLWALAALGLIVLCFDKRLTGKRSLILIFFLCSFLSVCPGFYFREHYFIPWMPAIGTLTGIFVNFPSKHKLFKVLSFSLLIASLAQGLWRQKNYFFRDKPIVLSRRIYVGNPFPESVAIADFIRSHTSPTDSVAILGSEPQLFFYSKRRSATGFIYMYPLMEDQPDNLAMQHEMARQIEAAKPKLVVYSFCPTSWLRRSSSPSYIFEWAGQYLGSQYQLAGVVAILPRETVIRWASELKGYEVKSPWRINVFQRKPEISH